MSTKDLVPHAVRSCLTRRADCPIHAEPVHHEEYAKFDSGIDDGLLERR